jgi:hypothetical protein
LVITAVLAVILPSTGRLVEDDVAVVDAGAAVAVLVRAAAGGAARRWFGYLLNFRLDLGDIWTLLMIT